MNFPKKEKGFTLIELLVVVSIIGVLATIVLSSLSAARGRARDQAIRAHFNQLRTALEIYYLDNNSYPDSYALTTGWCGTTGSAYGGANCQGTSGTNGWVPGLAPDYIPELRDEYAPVALTGGGAAIGGWMYRGDERGYKIMLHYPNEFLSRDVSTDDPMRGDNVRPGLRPHALVICENTGSFDFCAQ